MKKAFTLIFFLVLVSQINDANAQITTEDGLPLSSDTHAYSDLMVGSGLGMSYGKEYKSERNWKRFYEVSLLFHAEFVTVPIQRNIDLSIILTPQMGIKKQYGKFQLFASVGPAISFQTTEIFSEKKAIFSIGNCIGAEYFFIDNIIGISLRLNSFASFNGGGISPFISIGCPFIF
jgi:hypothetical protein